MVSILFFSGYAGDESKIKWPNDLYWRDRKAGGILIENILHGPVWKWAVVGIGININQTDFGAEAGNPVSLKQITGKEWNPIEAADKLLDHLDREIKLMLGSPAEISKRYHQALYKWKQVQEFRNDEGFFTARIDGVTGGGQLSVTHHTQVHFNTGEIEWVIR